MNCSVLIVERPDDRRRSSRSTGPAAQRAHDRADGIAVPDPGIAGRRSRERRVVILRGAGPAFCAGLDLYEAAETERGRADAARGSRGPFRPWPTARWSRSRPSTARPTRAEPA